MELRKILAYRSDFWITFLGQTLLQFTIARALWQSIFEYQGANSMQGFTLEMITLYYLLAPIGSKILTGENVGFLSREIYEGTFTRYLIYPLSAFHYKTITYLTHSCFYAFQLIIFYFLYHLIFQAGSVNIVNLSMGLMIYLMAAFVYLLFSMSIELLSLWADNIWTLTVMFRFFTSFLGGGTIPLAFFPEQVQDFLQWTPFPYLVSFPLKTCMGLITPDAFLGASCILLGWAIIAILIVRLVWMRGQKNYVGVGI